jgi:hypothetical protein
MCVRHHALLTLRPSCAAPPCAYITMLVDAVNCHGTVADCDSIPAAVMPDWVVEARGRVVDVSIDDGVLEELRSLVHLCKLYRDADSVLAAAHEVRALLMRCLSLYPSRCAVSRLTALPVAGHVREHSQRVSAGRNRGPCFGCVQHAVVLLVGASHSAS